MDTNKESNDLKHTLLYIMKRYLANKSRPLKKNPLAHYIKSIAPKNIEAVISKKYGSPNKYKVDGSAGMGNWSTIPFLAILDNDLSHSTQQGLYPVYLFSADMQRVYLSMALGWHYFKNLYNKTSQAQESIQIVAENFRQYLTKSKLPEGYKEASKSAPLKLITSNQKLNTDLPKGYSAGTIVYMQYNIDSMPTNDKLEEDLYKMIEAVSDLPSHLPFYNEFQSGSELITKNIEFVLHEEMAAKETNDSSINTPKYLHRSPYKPDYRKLNEENRKLGFLGEQFVLEKEKEELIKEGANTLAKKVEQVSLKDDGLGYDIKSFDKCGKKKLIEVKTTKGPSKTPFFISANEWSNRDKDNFFVYQVSNFQIDNNGKKDGTITKYKGKDLENILNLTPFTFRATFK